MNLNDKIESSIALIKKSEKLAMYMNNLGFYVAFSGGKDSQVLMELVKMAGVKYRAVYNVTTNDPADNIRFIRQFYNDVFFEKPKESFFQLVAKKGLPTMLRRYCCSILKEKSGVGYVVLTGVRADESYKRSKYSDICKWNSKDNIDIDKMEQVEFQCVDGHDKFLVFPILHWTDLDVWHFIRDKELPINPCYRSHKRVGCVYCPFSSKKQIVSWILSHPKQYAALLHNIQKYIDKRISNGFVGEFSVAEDYFNWWLSKKSIRDYKDMSKQTLIDFNYE